MRQSQIVASGVVEKRQRPFPTSPPPDRRDAPMPIPKPYALSPTAKSPMPIPRPSALGPTADSTYAYPKALCPGPDTRTHEGDGKSPSPSCR